MLYWTAQIVGSLIMAVILDTKNVSRRVRAFRGWALVFIMVWVCHGWGYHYQKSANVSSSTISSLLMHNHRQYTRASIAAIAPEDKIDFSAFWPLLARSFEGERTNQSLSIGEKQYVGRVYVSQASFLIRFLISLQFPVHLLWRARCHVADLCVLDDGCDVQRPRQARVFHWILCV